MSVDMYINIDTLQGESQRHDGAIDVLAWSWGETNSGSSHTGTGSGTGKVNVHDLTFTKYVDISSPNLWLYCANGKHIATATLTVLKAAGDQSLPYLVIKLTNVMVTSMSTGGSGGEDQLTENVTLNFSQYDITYTKQASSGQQGGQQEAGWNIATNSAT